MSFVKYPSIENHYRGKFIREAFQYNPELHNAEWVVQEKIDGANISLIFYTDGREFQFAKRTSLVDDKFYGFQEVLEREDVRHFIQAVQDAVNKYDGVSFITLYGELYGPGIQKRIDYGTEKSVVFYDMAVDGELVKPCEFRAFSRVHLVDSSFDRFFVPEIGRFKSFQEAMDVDAEFVTKLNPAGGDICEGVVIKPDDVVPNRIFYIKKKNEKFQEQARTKTRKDPNTQQSQALTGIQDLFSTYLTENRLKSVFSKHGEIETPKDMGKYIKLVMEDAKEDFLKDHKDKYMSKELSDKERGKVFGIAGKIVASLLRKYT